MTRDGYHLNYVYGRYTAACTWFESIFQRPVDGNPYSPEGITPAQKRLHKNPPTLQSCPRFQSPKSPNDLLRMSSITSPANVNPKIAVM